MNWPTAMAVTAPVTTRISSMCGAIMLLPLEACLVMHFSRTSFGRALNCGREVGQDEHWQIRSYGRPGRDSRDVQVLLDRFQELHQMFENTSAQPLEDQGGRC